MRRRLCAPLARNLIVWRCSLHHGTVRRRRLGTDKINGKIQRAEEAKVHTMLVIGPRDMQAGNVSVRVHGKGNLGARCQRRNDSGLKRPV